MDTELAKYMERIATSFERIADSFGYPAMAIDIDPVDPEPGTATAADEKKAKTKPAKAKPKAAPKADASLTLDDVRQALIPLGATARDVLIRHQCSKLSDLDTAKYESVIAEATGLHK